MVYKLRLCDYFILAPLALFKTLILSNPKLWRMSRIWVIIMHGLLRRGKIRQVTNLNQCSNPATIFPQSGGELIFVLIWFNNLVSSFNIDSRIRYWPSCGKICINDAIQFPSLDSVSSIFLGLDFFATHQDNFFQGLCSQDKMAAQMVDLRKAQVRFLSSN